MPDTDEEYEKEKEEIEANMQLYASAPELLEAFKESLKHHQGGHSEIGHLLRDVIEKATNINKQ